MDNGFIYFIAETDLSGNSTDAILAKINSDGSIDEECSYFLDVNVRVETINEIFYEDVSLTEVDGNHNPLPLNNSLSEVSLNESLLCIRICEEICDNEIDDDGNGLIDQYDPQCPCTFYNCEKDQYENDCPTCVSVPPLSDQWSLRQIWSNTFTEPSGTTTFVVGDIDDDCIPEVIALSRETDELYVIDGQTGQNKFIVPTYPTGAGTNGQIAIADVDRNGFGDIFILSGESNDPSTRNRLIRYEYDGNTIVERYVGSKEIGPFLNYDTDRGPRYDMPTINLADVNYDGRPEAVVGNEVYDAINGSLLTFGGPANSIGAQLAWVSNSNLGKLGSNPVLADVLPDFYCGACEGLELVAGNMVYSIGLIGGGPNTNVMNVEVDMSNEFGDGMTSVADVNLDGQLDVITTYGLENRRHTYGVAVWNPISSTLYDKIEFTNNGAIGPGRTSAANLDSNPNDIEFVLRSNPNLIVYKFNPVTNQIEELNRTTVDDPSRTATSIFDFDGDGQNEILYRDEREFRVLKGNTLQDLIFPIYLCGSNTNAEYPIVADANGDGQAEILIMCDNQIRLIGNNENGKFWSSARKVWNQFSYFSVNINDDLTIPIEQQRHQLAGDGVEFNTFLKQYTLPNIPVADAVVDILNISCLGDVIEFELELCNDGDNILTEETPIAFYQGNPTNSAATLLDIQRLAINLNPEQCETILFSINSQVSDSIFVVINDNASLNMPYSLNDDFPSTTIPECDYLNNIDGAFIENSFPTIDLGPDINVCDNAAWTLDAGIGFTNYLWSTTEREQRITVWEPGLYWVEVDGPCGEKQRDSIEIIVNPITEVELPDDYLTCPGDSLELSIEGFENYKWYLQNIIDCDTCSNIKIQIEQADTVVVVVDNGQGCYSLDSLFIMLDSSFILRDTFAICNGDSIQIQDSIIYNPGSYNFLLESSMSCDTNLIVEIVTQDSFYTFIDTAFCLDLIGDTIELYGREIWFPQTFEVVLQSELSGCDSIIEVRVEALTTGAALTTQRTCEGQNTGSIRIDDFSGTEPYRVMWNNGVTMGEDLVNLGSGEYNITITDANGCEIEFESIEVREIEAPNINLEDTISILLGQTYQVDLDPDPNPQYTYQWTPEVGLSCSNCPEPEISPNQNQLYQLVVSANGNCADTAFLFINLNSDRNVFFPNVFSPNGDNINDQFFPTADDSVGSIITFMVFDRWGNQIFQRDNFDPNDPILGWDGKFRDQHMNPGVFVYYAIVEFVDGLTSEYKGSVTLIR
ncbi:MAG: FG-GAP-like repeat-containing protein [Bacteroidota bacterium]